MNLRMYIALLFIGLSPEFVSGQHISPTDLLQMHKYWQLNDPHADRNTVGYLFDLDKNWQVALPPKIDSTGYMSILCYTKDGKSWYKFKEYQFTLAIQPGNPLKKSLVYSFTDEKTWKEYNQQMQLMEAEKLGSGPNQGGKQTIYTVNDIAFILVEFPPGIMGVDRTYQVTILKNTR